MQVLCDPVIAVATSLGLAILLFGSAGHKLRHADEFAAVLDAYDILPASLIVPATWLLAFGEACIAVGLLVPESRPESALVAAMLFVAYGAIMAFTLARGRRVGDCGCSLGRSRQRVSAALVWRNLVLALLSVNLARPMGLRDLGAYDWSMIVLVTVIGGVFYALANTLIAVHHSTRELFHD